MKDILVNMSSRLDLSNLNIPTIKMDDRQLLIAGIALCLSAIAYLALSQKQRDTIIQRLGLPLRGRRASSARTPPRSLSPDKKVESNIAPKSTEYVSTFPPDRREALAKVAQSLPSKQREAMGDLAFDLASLAKSVMGFDDDFRTCDEAKYTPMGISVKEVKALGDFPDYASLSDVPLPEPYAEFDIDKAIARPYRPFRWAYHQTMCKSPSTSLTSISLDAGCPKSKNTNPLTALTKLETNWWLELESTYRSRITQRKALYAEHAESVLQWLPGSELPCKELMEMTLQFLCARYPHYFQLSVNDAGKNVLENKILGTTQVVSEKHPLLVMLDNIPEDFALMLRNPETGYYHFRAGMICSALGWNTGTKIGLQLHQIHAPIPDYKEKMQFSMDR